MHFIAIVALSGIIPGALAAAQDFSRRQIDTLTILQAREHDVDLFPRHAFSIKRRHEIGNHVHTWSNVEHLSRRSPIPARPGKQKQSPPSTSRGMYRGSDGRAAEKQNRSASPSGSSPRTQRSSSPVASRPPAKAWGRTKAPGAMELTTGHHGQPNHQGVPMGSSITKSVSHPDGVQVEAITHSVDGKSSMMATGQKAHGYVETGASGTGILQSYGSGGVETKIVGGTARDNIAVSSKSGRPVAVKTELYAGRGGGGGALGGASAEN